MSTISQMVREFQVALQAPAGNMILSRDTAAFHEALFGPKQHDDHVREYRITRKLAGWSVSTEDMLADLRRSRA